jgi:2,4-didehydro-3-deoxy-L-rhamnonate hydrolase
MKLLRWGELCAEKPGVLDADGRIRDQSSIVGDINGAMLGSLADIPDIETLPLVPGMPRLYLRVGQLVRLGIDGLGVQTQRIVAHG